MRAVIGLGNPGKQYLRTRHNAGFMALDFLAEKLGLTFSFNKKFNAEIAEGKTGKEKIILVKPQTFMNESGRAVRTICDFYKIQPKEILVIHDDKDITLGEFKKQTNRGSAGHNGVESVIQALKSKNFTRLRLGVKPEKEIKDTADFVLAKFTVKEMKVVEQVLAESLSENII